MQGREWDKLVAYSDIIIEKLNATGLVTDACARVLDAQDQPIPGLYAVGNDMNSIMGGIYTAPGITIGPGLVFASLAARDAADRAKG